MITPQLPSSEDMTRSGEGLNLGTFKHHDLLAIVIMIFFTVFCRNKLAIDCLIEDHHGNEDDSAPLYPPLSLLNYMEFLMTFDPLIQHCLVSSHTPTPHTPTHTYLCIMIESVVIIPLTPMAGAVPTGGPWLTDHSPLLPPVSLCSL